MSRTSLADNIIDIEIESLNLAGDGVARHRGDRIEVPFTLPGERVRVRLGPPDERPGAATLVEVLRASAHRVIPPCPHFGPHAEAAGGTTSTRRVGPCGGCAWQHIAYPEQLRLKTELVDRLVRRAVPDAPAARPMLPGAPPGDPWGYRHKVHFTFGHAERPGTRTPGALLMGHYVRGSRRLIPVRECPVHDPRGNALAFRLRDAYAAGGTGSHTTLRGIAIRAGYHTEELMATLIVAGAADKRLRAVTRRAIEREPLTALHLNVHPEDDGFIFGRETRRLDGAERIREQVADTSFLISPTAFFQTNVRAAETLVTLVLEAVPAAARVLDLYAGAGLFALPLARAGHEVVAVEENREAVADGEASLRLNRIAPHLCRFLAQPVERAVRSALRGSLRMPLPRPEGRPGAGTLPPGPPRRGERRSGRAGGERVAPADVVILDPPRAGCAPSVIRDVFGGLRPAQAVYISCNPAALAHDLGAVAAHGYTVSSIQPVDMFPHTAHVETVVVVTGSPPGRFPHPGRAMRT